MRRVTLLVAVVVLVAGCASQGRTEGNTVTGDASTAFEVGQAWSYRARPGEEGSVLLIGAIDEGSEGPVFHIQVQNVSVPNPRRGSPETMLPHLPVSRAALAGSVLALAHGELERGPFELGYRTWKDDRGGVFTIPLDEIVDLVEASLP